MEQYWISRKGKGIGYKTGRLMIKESQGKYIMGGKTDLNCRNDVEEN